MPCVGGCGVGWGARAAAPISNLILTAGLPLTVATPCDLEASHFLLAHSEPASGQSPRPIAWAGRS